ncbi:MAG: hypothetical protein RDV48_04835 [Candidatus Eremiobacteraeota bacterium]|nr:hypothetical protein [Candidatus Eremiobacteraeota bacterium]
MLELQIEKISSLLSDNPDDVATLMAYGEYHLRRGRRLEALQAYQKVTCIKEDIHEAHLALARIYMLQNMPLESYREILTALERAPSNLEARILYDRLSDILPPPHEVQEKYELYHEQEPDLEEMRLYRRQRELEIEMLDDEIKHLEQAVKDDETDPICEYHFEMALKRKHNIEEIFQYIEKWESHLTQKHEREMEAEREREEHEREEHEREEHEREEHEREEHEREEREREEREREEREREEREREEREREEREREEREREEREREERERLEHEKELEEALRAQAGGVSEARRKYYEEIKDSVNSVLQSLIKTKGVSAVITLSREGFVIDSINNEAIEVDEIAQIVKSGIDAVGEFRQDEKGKAFIYWVLEFEQGLMVVRTAGPSHILITIAKAGANFGAMRYSMEKGKETLEELFAHVPAED